MLHKGCTYACAPPNLWSSSRLIIMSGYTARYGGKNDGYTEDSKPGIRYTAESELGLLAYAMYARIWTYFLR